jgi:hypothetical protein
VIRANPDRSGPGGVVVVMAAQSEPKGGRWQLWVGLFVAVGSLGTIAFAVIETFWG